MQTPTAVEQKPESEHEDVYTFKREDGTWYVHLPTYLKRDCDRNDLRMIDGACKFLNVLSNGAKKLRLRISTQHHKRAGKLELVEHCEAPKGGAIYLFTPPTDQAAGALFWICDLALLVFGDIPERIYVQRLYVK